LENPGPGHRARSLKTPKGNTHPGTPGKDLWRPLRTSLCRGVLPCRGPLTPGKWGSHYTPVLLKRRGPFSSSAVEAIGYHKRLPSGTCVAGSEHVFCHAGNFLRGRPGRTPKPPSSGITDVGRAARIRRAAGASTFHHRIRRPCRPFPYPPLLMSTFS
jgi:hypothetical protein